MEHKAVPSTLIVTGAGRGIGLATVRASMGKGLQVHGLDIHVPAGLPRDDQGIHWHAVDVANEQQVQSFFTDKVKPGSVAGLVNCAGAVERTSIIAADVAEWERMLAVNLSSTFMMIREFIAYASTAAAIVNVSSVDARYGHPERLGYAVAKGGVEALTRVTAGQLADRGIRVNTVVPGAIATRMTPDTAAGHRCLLRRCGEPEEIADAIMFLLSPKASYITGSTLHVDGGMGLR